MRKILLILLPLLLLETAHSDISGRRDSLMVMSFEQSLVPDVGNSLIDTLYGARVVNRSIQRVCTDFPAYENLDTVVSVQGTISYALNADFRDFQAIFKLTTYQDLKIIYGLQFPPAETWFEAKAGEIGGQGDPQEKPEPRYASEFAKQVFFYPTPQRADSFVVAYYAMDRQLTADDSVTNVLPEFREAVVIYAAAIICYRKGDFTRAGQYITLYNSWVIASKTGGIPQQ